MRKLVIPLLALSAIAGTSAAEAHKKPHSLTQKGAVPRVNGYRAARAGTRTTKYQSTARSPQGPSLQRHKEIQQALADKGYYKGEVDGQWKPESTDALRRFQADQNLRVDGKIGSLSLIALGLGPKRTLTAQTKTAPVPAAQTEIPRAGVPE